METEGVAFKKITTAPVFIFVGKMKNLCKLFYKYGIII